MHRLLSPIVFCTVCTIGLGMSYTLREATQTSNHAEAELIADEAVDRVAARLGQHMSLLRATRSFFAAGDQMVSRARFNTFVSGLEMDEHYPGGQGIGFAELISSGQEQQIEDNLIKNYAIDRPVWPTTDQPLRTPITLIEPLDPRNNAALGFDMFHEPIRRGAMESALLAGNVTATGPVELVQEIGSEKQAGFLVYVPLHHPDDSIDDTETIQPEQPVKGFIYSPFRAGDFFTTALTRRPLLPIKLKAYDKERPEYPLYTSEGFEESESQFEFLIDREMDFAGRKWIFEIGTLPEGAWTVEDITPYVVGSISILLALLLAFMTRSQLRALDSAHKLQALSEKSLKDKELLLGEMKHRIKNSIARIMAISRQTLLHSDSLDAFSTSFNARLQAMANAQDALTRSHWQRAELLDLLAKELEQVLGEYSYKDQVSGPKVDLNEATAQALGLTFHELATNALKYSDVANSKDTLSVTWTVTEDNQRKVLKILWRETNQKTVKAPTHKGFGTKLIDANILGELQGEIERQYSENGLLVKITIPLKSKNKKKLK
ncbi:CHASE domain-containing protein [Cohaesibacter celericrescens]|uniref:histidine kinase n=1 Tax=Cohaesibacter celericrescens TaxID=2067669 RepID=A0A2N5XSB1_9HYPH|nr:CHASE domain-containing protein [Cohaesibacter celericrescens]PLW77337.1 histidine kinase [Cohaesibacter celericrescens]